METRRLIWILSVVALLGACDRGQERGKDARTHGDEASIAVTHYTGETELFVEFPALVKGEEAAFVAHLTRLADFKAVSEGTLVVRLSGGGQPEEAGESGVTGTPGIFKPRIAPRHAGKRRLSFTLSSPKLNLTHDLGEVEVFGDAKAAAAAAKSCRSYRALPSAKSAWARPGSSRMRTRRYAARMRGATSPGDGSYSGSAVTTRSIARLVSTVRPRAIRQNTR